MKPNHLKSFFLLVMVMLFSTATLSFAGVNMDLENKLILENPPLDVVTTPDGKYIFVLTDKGGISVFDQKGVLQNKIHVGGAVDQIRMDPQGNRLFVTSRQEKTVKVISLDFFVEINTAGAPYKGPENAPVVLAVFSDFQCPYCSRLSPLLEQTLKKYPKSVKIVFKNFPLSSHKFAKKAAAAALAAGRQGKFWEFHDELFKNYRNLDDKKILEIAKKLELEEARFKQGSSGSHYPGRNQPGLRGRTESGSKRHTGTFHERQAYQQPGSQQPSKYGGRVSEKDAIDSNHIPGTRIPI